ncbi:UDPGP type 1 family protein [Proteiniclasticum sp. QWL-01]|uniref:UDPGP type 1 family protein n=1 Tax=Proteiniclasticum sp. QWL-01 TaxID=3036945 RepID=UPI00240F00B0|nr:UDPGP type 1 family protein [Proteiniclasticum sp. QWL-01]WFF72014.1 UDPGP type 1 family protein [Proteiniclasticum sp. QWL-01]
MTREMAWDKLTAYGQEHLLRFYDDLDSEQQQALLEQIADLDVEYIHQLYQDLVEHRNIEIDDELSAMGSTTWSDVASEERQRLWESGLAAIGQGKVAAFLVAGGQGSRLGFEGPKGAYDIGLPSHKSLFQLQAERIRKIGLDAGFSIPWYIMTSPLNHGDTVRFFQKHDFFGLDPADIRFFPQGTLPSVDENGKILLAQRDRISANPDGSGGCFRAFKDAGLMDDLQERGIEYIFFYGVDNALVRVCDPYFIGFAIDQAKDIASKAVLKVHSGEKVGVYAYRNGKPSIIEYTELPEDLALAQDEQGRLVYGSANIVTHVFRTSFLNSALDKKTPYHVAHKAVEYVDEAGQLVKPLKPNAYKFEALYFDLFRYADDMAILNVSREEEFSPVKNFEGVDSKDTAREMFLNLCTSWVRNLDLEPAMPIEISPLLSIYGHDLDRTEVESRLKDTESGYLAP